MPPAVQLSHFLAHPLIYDIVVSSSKRSRHFGELGEGRRANGNELQKGTDEMKTVRHSCLLILLSAAFVAVPASAQDFGYRGLDVHAGVSLPSDWDAGWTVGVSANIGEIVDGLYLYPAIFYSQAEDSEGFFGTDVDLEVSALAVGAEIRYFLEQELRGFYFGGGVYLNRVEAEFGVRSGQVVVVAEDESDAVGAMGVAGYRLPLGDVLSGAVEARYNAVSDFDGPSLLLVFGF